MVNTFSLTKSFKFSLSIYCCRGIPFTKTSSASYFNEELPRYYTLLLKVILQPFYMSMEVKISSQRLSAQDSVMKN